MMDEQQMVSATNGLVAYLNENIEAYSGKFSCARILYSMQGWAEVYATGKHNCCAEDFALKLIRVLEEIKETNGASGFDMSKPLCAWFANGGQRGVMLGHGINLDFLEWLDVEEE